MDGWKLAQNLVDVIGAVSSIASVVVFLRIREIRKDLLTRAALPDLRIRLEAANQNLVSAIKRKGDTGVHVADLRGLASDLLEQASGRKHLRAATSALIAALKPNSIHAARLAELSAKVTTVVTLITSAERDQKTWSLSK